MTEWNLKAFLSHFKDLNFYMELEFIIFRGFFFHFSLKLKSALRPDLGGNEGNTIPNIKDFTEEYNHYFDYHKFIETNEELYELEQIKSQDKGKTVDYSEVQLEKWTESPTTPKASSSKLPNQSVMIPITKD